MNWLLILVLVLLIGNAFWGYKKGLLRVAFSLVSWILVLGICYIGAPMAADMLIEQTDIETVIQEKLTSAISNYTDGIEMSAQTISVEMQEMLAKLGVIENIDGVPVITMDAVTSEEVRKIIVEYTYMVISFVCIIAGVIIARVAETLIDAFLGIFSKLPLIGSVNKFFGFVLGGVKGLLLCWLVLAVVVMLALTGINTEWITMVQDSQILLWLNDHNLIMNMILQLM